MLRATLEVCGSIEVQTSQGAVEVRIVPPERLRSGPPSPFYTPLTLFRIVRSVVSHVWRWLRRDHRWFVVVAPVGAGNRDGEVWAEVESRSEAIDRGVAVAEELASGV
jgi:hypothetical protein